MKRGIKSSPKNITSNLQPLPTPSSFPSHPSPSVPPHPFLPHTHLMLSRVVHLAGKLSKPKLTLEAAFKTMPNTKFAQAFVITKDNTHNLDLLVV